MTNCGLPSGSPGGDYQVEMCVLGSMLLSAKAADTALGLLNKEDFTRPQHARIFEVFGEFRRDRRPLDALVLAQQEPEVCEIGYMVALAEYVPSPANVQFYAEIVRDRAMLRSLRRVATDTIQAIEGATPQDALPLAEKVVSQVSQALRRQASGLVSASDLVTQAYNDLVKWHAAGRPKQGIQTGIWLLDQTIMGMMPGDLWVLGARPGMGKTAFALMVALSAARQNLHGATEGESAQVAILSLEMSSRQMVHRMTSIVSGLPVRQLREEKMVSDEVNSAWAFAFDKVAALPIVIDDETDVTVSRMGSAIRALRFDRGVKLVIVDYLQLLRGDRRDGNRVNEVAEISRALKRMAKENGCPVLALSQLSRPSGSRRDGDKPVLSDLRESGSIEADADGVLLIHRTKANEDYGDDEVEPVHLIVAKNRHGETREVILGYQRACTRFVNMDSYVAARLIK